MNNNFEQEVIERLARIETKIEFSPCKKHEEKINHAHKRIYKLKIWILCSWIAALGALIKVILK